MENDKDIRSNNIKVEAKIKMAEKKDMELTSSHKYTKNNYTCETILTEYLLQACRRSHTNKATRKMTT